MGAESKIQWTDATFNPWIGCAKVSDGCKNCYAEVQTFARVQRGRGVELWGPQAVRHRTSAANWREPEKWDREAMATGDRLRVFCASLCDVFEDRRDLDPWRDDLFSLIDHTPWLDWQLLTKRPENMVRLAPRWWSDGWPPNAWAGCTVEDQPRADERIAYLRRVPAAVRFLSVEPQLGEVSIRRAVASRTVMDDGCGIHWCIIGGESGPGAREFNVAWARSLLAECRKWKIAPFVKQLGAHVITRNDDGLSGCDEGDWNLSDPDGQVEHDLDGTRDGYQGAPVRVHLRDRKGGDMNEFPADLRIREFPNAR